MLKQLESLLKETERTDVGVDVSIGFRVFIVNLGTFPVPGDVRYTCDRGFDAYPHPIAFSSHLEKIVSDGPSMREDLGC